MNCTGLVSIIMATFNRAHLIEKSLESISQQTCANWECIIIDDGSTDNTQHIIETYSGRDNRFQYYLRNNTYNKGLPGSRNMGLDMANGQFILFIDDDDYAHPQLLEICCNYLENNLYAFFCHYLKQPFTTDIPEVTSAYLPNGDYSITNTSFYEDFVTYKTPMASCTVMWRAMCFTGQRFNEELTYAEEWECYTRLLVDFSVGILLNKILYFNRKHPHSNTYEFYSGNQERVESKKKAIQLIMNMLKKKGKLLPGTSNYLINTALGFNDIDLINILMTNAELNLVNRFILRLKFYSLPIRRTLKRLKTVI
ncbi:glycosyltransferase family 2 protein [Winogradskyella aurantiaca]|uniref:glycosyltransferase family 2 protein n=1 Tax=Winogradskyella aurantiaca TaxID=2219558 RepID=UPI000E1E0A1D|nr:glycosyltransferase family 2 protein [Winogradskyella aurantiaca]